MVNGIGGEKVKRRDMIFALSISVALLGVLSFQAFTTAERARRLGSPPQEPMMAPDQLLERSWFYLCFKLNLTEEQLTRLRQAYREAWQESNRLRERLRTSRTDPETARRLFRAEMERIRSALHDRLKNILTPNQMGDLLRWEELQSRFPPRPRRR